MTSTDFVYWLNGYFEISGANSLDEKQVKIIKDHLNLVFTKVTPPYDLEENILKFKSRVIEYC